MGAAVGAAIGAPSSAFCAAARQHPRWIQLGLLSPCAGRATKVPELMSNPQAWHVLLVLAVLGLLANGHPLTQCSALPQRKQPPFEVLAVLAVLAEGFSGVP